MAISKSGDRWTVTSQRWFIVLQRGDSFKRSCRLKEIKERVDRSKRFESDPGIEMDPREGEGVKGGTGRGTAISSNNRCLSRLSRLTRGARGEEGTIERRGGECCIIKAIRGSRIRYSTSYITNMIIRGQPAPKGVRLCLGRGGFGLWGRLNGIINNRS